MNQPKPNLTPRQRDVLAEIARLEGEGETVTTARLSATLSMPRQNVRTYMMVLRDQGYARYQAAERHTAIIHITDKGRALLGKPPSTLSLPIVGEVAAGQPGYAEERIEGYATRLQDVLEIHEGDFLLRVRGESMLGVGIYPGDLVVIRPMEEEPHSGEIALVAVPGEDTATLKRWHRDNGTVTLISENPSYEPLSFPAQNVQVQGCLVGHIGTGRARHTR
ncbi:repressor LexA [Deinococcus sp. HSC-46F16]|uniref:LexA family protein n=1 Tax=Deinococcus sp. HSC-46F16 TaxID=2910968 RepID=UPI0020A08C8F|nr:S24 family peptidase [Deinococcus sp. HSC-46F16]MCP2013416.1 repressor LexA [Deinococcus sp. HSC-46F16]